MQASHSNEVPPRRKGPQECPWSPLDRLCRPRQVPLQFELGWALRTMHCQGPLGIGHCPSQLSVDPTSESDLELLSSLHLDHSIPLETICSLWIEIIQSQRQPLSSWDEGVDGDLLCQLIFGVQDHQNLITTKNPLWRANVQFRCYHAIKRSGCHDMTCRANSNMKLSINDLRA